MLLFSVNLQIQGVSVEFDNLKKALASNETAKEIDETEKRLKVRSSLVLFKDFPYVYFCLDLRSILKGLSSSCASLLTPSQEKLTLRWSRRTA